jgi:SRSO17 transposase
VSRTAKAKRKSRRLPPASGRTPSRTLSEADWQALSDELIRYHRRVREVFGRREQRQWSIVYLCGQLSDLERKTIEPMVLKLVGPDRNAVRGLQQFTPHLAVGAGVGQGSWSAGALLQRLQALAAEWLAHPEGVLTRTCGGAGVVDGSGFPKQGLHSAGVARQYCDALGKVANCQEGVFAVYASPAGATLVDARLYLPAEWFDEMHRAYWPKIGLPNETTFQTEPALSLAMITELVERGQLPFAWVTADPHLLRRWGRCEHFGHIPGFLDGVAALGKWYFAEVPTTTRVWLRTPALSRPGPGPLGQPRPQPRLAPNAPRPVAVRDWLRDLPAGRWRRYTIKEGSRGPMVAAFAFERVTLVRDRLPGPRAWLIVRRSLGLQPEVKYYLSNALATCAPVDLARLSGWRWPIETVLEEAKGEVGLDHYETRTWPGWHHHVAQTGLAHLFLVRLQTLLKKSATPDRLASPPTDGAGAGGRQRPTRSARAAALSPGAQSCRLSFASQAHP